ncbi:GLPGLI family protein [Flavobacterium jejuense]|uniref:GLPGLI family protein n=1 Tax=Flavobacterium jejuense TaxID=1544455 RepID=A0ABX0IRV5_9FLAO|nr:GLPGLI family protein [Flavobacterium jejuense]NHN26579.1 GLPGLI family protein [Flavobacterium jejuense]
MKSLFFLLLFISSFAQEKQGIVNYGYIKSLLLGNKNGHEFNAQLIFDGNQSYFVSEKDSLENDINNNTQIQTLATNEKDGNTKTIGAIGNRAFLTTFTGNQIYYNKNKDSLWSYLRNPKNMYISEKKPLIKWNFNKETKKIGVYTCHKASATFRGRDYIVWYTTEIPIPYGPWKFNGLPGLVLEAYDTDFYIYFFFKNIQYPLEKIIKIDFIKESPDSSFIKWYTYEDYLKIIEEDNATKYEKMLLAAKQMENFFPVKPKIRERYIEITN